MKSKLFLSILMGICWVALAATTNAQVPGLINYQGRIVDGGTNFDGTGQFEFALVSSDGSTNYWSNDGTAAGQPGIPVTLSVTKGLYSVLLGDTTITHMTAAVPASVFANSTVLLRVWFNDGVTGFQQLSPDQRIAAAGYALQAQNACTASLAASTLPTSTLYGQSLDIGTNNTVAGGVYAGIAGGSNNIASAAEAFIGGGAQNTASAADSFVGGGLNNSAGQSYAAVAGGFNNQATGPGAFVGGGGFDGFGIFFIPNGNVASGAASTVAGGNNNSASNDYATVAGGYGNQATGPGSFVGGGGYDGLDDFHGNTASGRAATVGGGFQNQALGDGSFVGGGGYDGSGSDVNLGNVAGNQASTVGGGVGNNAGDIYATVAGGFFNTASGVDSFVGGGGGNHASAFLATVGGGSDNTASGTGSFVGGGGFDGNISGGNTASGAASTVAGGVLNTAGSIYATVGGGLDNHANDFATVAGGRENQATGSGAVVGGGGFAAGFAFGNIASGNAATVGGGLDNQATEPGAFVGGGGFDGNSTIGNVAGGPACTVGGGVGNNAGNIYDTVGGGEGNTANGGGSVVGGGSYNTASGFQATVAGGGGNHASGRAATVGGGVLNQASGTGSFVGGGGFDGTSSAGNTASGAASTVGGGLNNTASGSYSTVPGGSNCVANGAASFAAGANATASHNNSFVWGDGTRAAASQGVDTFAVLATGAGGVGFFVGNNVRVSIGYTATHDIDVTSGAFLSHAGVWTSVSDRNVKGNFADINAREVLERVLAMPVQSWNYNAEDPSIRHIGPMAQDFYSAFRVGSDDKHIGAIDEGGVAFAAIQGLNQKLEEKDAQITELRQELVALKATVQKISEQVEQSKAPPIQAANVRNSGGM